MRPEPDVTSFSSTFAEMAVQYARTTRNRKQLQPAFAAGRFAPEPRHEDESVIRREMDAAVQRYEEQRCRALTRRSAMNHLSKKTARSR
jgi:hypothetical protein